MERIDILVIRGDNENKEGKKVHRCLPGIDFQHDLLLDWLHMVPTRSHLALRLRQWRLIDEMSFSLYIVR